MSLRKGFTREVERTRERYVGACKAAQRKPSPALLADVHFHDTRHEVASRLSMKQSNVLKLSTVTDHEDLRMPKRFCHPRAEELAAKLG